MAKFIGFNTINTLKPPFTITDTLLIKRDLLNEFYTRRGERVMRPNFGSIIWDLLMDPAGPDLDGLIREDVLKIIDRDPRVEHIKTEVYILDHTIRIEIDLRYVNVRDVDTLYVEYTRDITEGIE